MSQTQTWVWFNPGTFVDTATANTSLNIKIKRKVLDLRHQSLIKTFSNSKLQKPNLSFECEAVNFI